MDQVYSNILIYFYWKSLISWIQRPSAKLLSKRRQITGRFCWNYDVVHFSFSKIHPIENRQLPAIHIDWSCCKWTTYGNEDRMERTNSLSWSAVSQWSRECQPRSRLPDQYYCYPSADFSRQRFANFRFFKFEKL